MPGAICCVLAMLELQSSFVEHQSCSNAGVEEQDLRSIVSLFVVGSAKVHLDVTTGQFRISELMLDYIGSTTR